MFSDQNETVPADEQMEETQEGDKLLNEVDLNDHLPFAKEE